MKTLFFKLLPGVLACAAVALGIGWGRAQSVGSPPMPMPATMPVNQNPIERPTLMGPAPAAAAVPQYIICGHCGARIEAPQAVWIAAPVAAAPRRGAPVPYESFYGIPPVGFVEPYGYGGAACYPAGYLRGADEQRFDLPPPRRLYR